MKKKINKLVAKLILNTATLGAGLASMYGWYQPLIPHKLTK
ncbi:MAG: cyclic lactone autoinducer peptide [Oscillospiraceae bacterium]|nr:cyclic lactone autoinducer peptide [Oscillospiraceae bacterium]